MSKQTQPPKLKMIQKKICMLGDFSVGKTSLVKRFVSGIYDDAYLSTIGVTLSRKPISLSDSVAVNLIIWDLAGGDEFTGIQANYLIGAAGALLVCDLTRPSTLQTAEKYAEVILTINPNAQLILLGNKADLVQESILTTQDLDTVAQNLSIPFHITSAKTGRHVDLAFEQLALSISK